MSKHTPGPWESGIKQSHGTEVRGPKGVSIAWCGQAMITGIHGSHSIRSAEANANARLIATAPELLTALQLAVRQNSHDMLMTGEELRQCEAAIAKATGEPNA